MSQRTTRPTRERVVLGGLGILAIALGSALVWAIAQVRQGTTFGGPVVANRVLEQEAIRRLVAEGAGLYDTDPDPAVGLMLLPSLEEREADGVTISTNTWGFREREIEAKAEGVLRVVLLGDSLVFGTGVEADARMGAQLEGFLAERIEQDVECLHVAVPGWNIRSASSFLRRHLKLLRPDLVVHFIQPDDLGDVLGARGFGGRAGFSPQVRSRADGVVELFRGTDSEPNYLQWALDAESRGRYGAAAEEMGALARAVRYKGGRYLVVSRWTGLQPAVREYFEPVLEAGELAFVSDEFAGDPRYRIAEEDRAWNRDGHAEVARMLYGLIEERKLLGDSVPPWDAASDAVARIQATGARDADDRPGFELRRSALELAASISTTDGDPPARRQIYGGITAGVAAPYASLVLAGPPLGASSQLVVRGAHLERGGLSGQVRVRVEGLDVGGWSLGLEGPIDERFDLPEELAGRPAINVTFESDDFVYATLAGYCISFRLESVAVE